MNKINIVMFNMSRYGDWQKGVVNRNYHVLHTLAKDDRVNKIIAVDFLPFSGKRAFKTYIQDQIFGDTRGTVMFGDLTSRCWQVSSKIFVYSTIDSVLRKQRIIKELKRIIAEQEIADNLVVWSYNPLYSDYFGQFDNATYVFDAVDNWAAHSSYSDKKQMIAQNYERIADQSNVIFTVSDELRSVFGSKPHVHWIPNGVEIGHFISETEIHDAVIGLQKPVIGFLGILQDRIDVELLESIAHNNPSCSLVLAGPVWKGFPKERLDQFKNVHFLGSVAYTDIPKLYNGFNVGIIPYKVNEFVKSTNSMKFYEYLAAGLPVVSTNCPGADQFGNYVNIAHSAQEFNELITACKNVNRVTSEQRKNLLHDKTWKHRVDTMIDLINTA